MPMPSALNSSSRTPPEKNATDSALIIDAMDLLHSRTISGFCIISTDSDFTRLAIRIREEGLFVMGIGRPETPESFVRACEVFVYTTNLISEQKEEQKPTADSKNGKDSKQVLRNQNDWTLRHLAIIKCLFYGSVLVRFRYGESLDAVGAGQVHRT